MATSVQKIIEEINDLTQQISDIQFSFMKLSRIRREKIQKVVDLGFSQRELSKVVGLSQARLSQIINGGSK